MEELYSITDKELETLNSIIQEYSRRKLELNGIKDFFPEVIQDIEKKLNALISISVKIRNMQSNTQINKRR
jgi:hypothetical protein